ncbi:hypothetical protein M0R45_026049 [Rubus argutus]|uniref:Uncharacterized protein n=1 Tax=Rubus argutus TaxID=59490 RepID=A0AAW1WYP7_RUBAR
MPSLLTAAPPVLHRAATALLIRNRTSYVYAADTAHLLRSFLTRDTIAALHSPAVMPASSQPCTHLSSAVVSPDAAALLSIPAISCPKEKNKREIKTG